MTVPDVYGDTGSHEPHNPQNSPLSFDDIFDKYRRPIYGYLLRLTQNPTEAEDLTQETFIKVNHSLSSFRGDSGLSTWLYRIATNVNNDNFRHTKARQAGKTVSLGDRDSVEESHVDSESISLEKSAERTEMSSCVQDFIGRLPVDYRTVLVLHDEQGLKNQEIADVLGCSLETVKIRLHRARNELRRRLKNGCCLTHDERNVLVCESKSEEAENR